MTTDTFTPDYEDASRMHDLESFERPTTAIIATVAAVKDVDPLDLSPLYDVVDPDALDTLFQRDAETTERQRVDFDYEGCHVVLTGGRDGSVRVERTEHVGQAE
ncbi:HalOD1 output domain-containing protein [Natrialbaceae archaeon A-CW3]